MEQLAENQRDGRLETGDGPLKRQTRDRRPETGADRHLSPATHPSLIPVPSPVPDLPSPAEAGELKRCPRCEESLSLSEFGICRARKDGLNLYCKRCVRQKLAQSRQTLREYKNARIKHGSSAEPKAARLTIDPKSGFSPRRIARMLRKLSPADRVREAIRCGAETQTEIGQVTKLPKDEVCDVLANLLLWTHEIRTQVINHTRMYFVNEDLAAPSHSFPKPREPRSHGVSTIYFQGEEVSRRREPVGW